MSHPPGSETPGLKDSGLKPSRKRRKQRLFDCVASGSTGFQPVPDVPQVENLRYGEQADRP